MAEDFVQSIKTRRKPLSDGEAGLNVVRVLEAADRSLRMGGQVIKLTGEANDEHVRLMVNKLKEQVA
jgi:hypothetical protein